MPSFRIDLHTHSYFSADGISDPREMIVWGRRNGLDGLVLTDHDTCEGIDFLRQHGLVRDDGLPVDDFLVIPGQEVTTREGHVLVVGWEPPSSRGISCSELLPMVREAGGLTIAAHPFDFARSGVGERVLKAYEFDALEAFNSASWLLGLNRRARQFGEAAGMVMTAGSDAHHPVPIGCARQVVDAPDLSVAHVVEAIRSGNTHREEKGMGLAAFLTKTWHNCFRKPVPDRELPGNKETDK